MKVSQTFKLTAQPVLAYWAPERAEHSARRPCRAPRARQGGSTCAGAAGDGASAQARPNHEDQDEDARGLWKLREVAPRHPLPTLGGVPHAMRLQRMSDATATPSSVTTSEGATVQDALAAGASALAAHELAFPAAFAGMQQLCPQRSPSQSPHPLSHLSLKSCFDSPSLQSEASVQVPPSSAQVLGRQIFPVIEAPSPQTRPSEQSSSPWHSGTQQPIVLESSVRHWKKVIMASPAGQESPVLHCPGQQCGPWQELSQTSLHCNIGGTSAPTCSGAISTNDATSAASGTIGADVGTVAGVMDIADVAVHNDAA